MIFLVIIYLSSPNKKYLKSSINNRISILHLLENPFLKMHIFTLPPKPNIDLNKLQQTPKPKSNKKPHDSTLPNIKK